MSKQKLIIVFTVLLDAIAVGAIVPVLPFYAESFGASPQTVTLLFSMYFVCAFFSTPFLGALSDRIGRRPVMIASILSTAIGWFVFASAKSIWMLFAGRIIDGIAAGNISTAQSYMTDISTSSKERTKNIGLLGAMFGVGFIVGPVIGGFMGHFSHTLPFWFVGFLSLANALLAHLFLKETNTKLDAERQFEFTPWRPFKRAFQNKALIPTFIAWFLFGLAAATNQSILALFVDSAFGLRELAVGIFATITGVVVTFNQGIGIPRFWLKRFNESSLAMISTMMLVVAFVLISIQSLILFVVGIVLGGFGQSLFRVVTTSHVAGEAHEQYRGEAVGVLNSIHSVSMIVGPLVVGLLFGIGISFPYFFAAGCMFVAFLIISARNSTMIYMKKLDKNIDFKIAAGVAIGFALVAGVLILINAEMPETSLGEEKVLSKQERSLVRGDTEYRDAEGEYTVMIPRGWFAHEGLLRGSVAGGAGDVSFTQQEVSPQTGGSAISEVYFSISKYLIAETQGVSNPGEWLTVKGFSSANPNYKEGLITRQGVYEMMRFVIGDKKTNKDTLHYVFFPDSERAIVFSHAPYVRGNDTAMLFDGLMKSFESSRGQQ